VVHALIVSQNNMDPNTLAATFGFIGTAIGGIISWLVQAQRNKHELQIHNETHKTDFAAETTARYYLMSESYTDRSFKTLLERIGGFSDDELRKILVRAGAIRLIRDDGSEWWRLLKRNQEAIKQKKQKDDKRG